MLQREGFRPDEADRVVARFFKTQRRRSFSRADKVSPPNSPPRKPQAPLTPRDQHVDLIAFSNNVSIDKASLFFPNHGELDDNFRFDRFTC